MRCKYFKLFNALTMENYNSAEHAMAKYTKLCGASIKEIIQLDIECKFGDDNRILIV